MLLSGTVVTAMGIVQMEQNRLRQQEIEVRALVAISECGNRTLANRALRSLCHICWPDDERFHMEIEVTDSVIEKWL